jgi:hypothetical protein
MSDQPTDLLLERFRAFGFVHLPGLLADDIGWIEEEFERVWAEHGRNPDGSVVAGVVPFVDRSERLCGLLDHPRLEPAVERLLGTGFNYLSSDGRPYRGDTGWHPDGNWDDELAFAKVAIYLDPLTRDTGALRVIPGSHLVGDRFSARSRGAGSAAELFGVAMDAVPAFAVEVRPGDVVVFDHNLMHGSFGGGSRRRMFTLNVGRRAATAGQFARLREYLSIHLTPWAPRTYGETMLRTATAARRSHLEQALANEGHLPELHAAHRARRAS